jgi:signal transduction histidine kinase
MKNRNAEEYQSALSSVQDDIRYLIDLANRLLLMARASAEGPLHFSKNIRIDEIVFSAREEILQFNKIYHINVSLDDSVDDANQLNIAGDESLLRVAVSNIMDNACKYSQDHTVRVTIKHAGNLVTLLFEDHGIGILPEDLLKIREPFYRGSNAKKIHGSGIGLALVNQIINNHNGVFNITSIPDAGTQVSIAFPVHIPVSQN